MLARALRRISEEDIEVSVGTICSGCDLMVKLIHELVCYWQAEFNVPIRVRHSFSCESNPKKQAFLRAEFKSTPLFANASELGSTMAVDISGSAPKRVPVETPALLVAGFSCKSRSPANPNSSAYKRAVQDGVGETGETFWMIAEYISVHKPLRVVLENVVELGAKPDGSESSDADFIVQWFAKKGYSAQWLVIDASDFGSAVRRNRRFLLAFYKAHQSTLRQATDIINSMMIGALPFKLFLIDDDEQTQATQAAAAAKGTASSVDVARTNQGKRAKTDPNFKTEHLEYFRAANIPWPVKELPSKIEDLHLTQRQSEVLLYCDTVAKPVEPGIEFVDVGCSLGRLCGENRQRRIWQRCCPTLTTHTKLVLRMTAGDMAHQFRVLHGLECMQLIGWDRSMYKSSPPLGELALDLAGNAFSGFSLGPVLLAVFAQFFAVGACGCEEHERAFEASDFDASDSGASSI